jgi:sugar lactone lactonase YvrE
MTFSSAALMVIVAAAMTMVSPAVSAQPVLNPKPLSSVPTPFVSGHAGLYAWGAATMPDGSVIIGDYWNRRVMHYAKTGALLGDLFDLAVGHPPFGLAVDPGDASIYVGMSTCCEVEKWSRDPISGSYTQRASLSHPSMKYPSRIAVTKDGSVYVADMRANQIFVFSSSGSYFSMFGHGILNQPRGIAFDGSVPQRLFVAEGGANRVDVFSTSGTLLRSWGKHGSNPGDFGGNLRGLGIDQARALLYVVDIVANKVHEYDLNGTWKADLGKPGGQSQRYGAAPPGTFSDGGRETSVDGDGNVWVGDMPNFRAQVFSSAGTFLFAVPDPAQPPPDGAFNAPQGVVVDGAGNMIVGDTFNFRLEKFDSTGSWLWSEGVRGGFSSYALNYTRNLAADNRDGSFVVADAFNNSIKKFDAGGNSLWNATRPGSGLGQFRSPFGVAVGPDGRVYVADTGNDRVQILDGATGATLATFGCPPASPNCLLGPTGIAVEAATQDLYVTGASKQVSHFTNAGGYLAAISGPGTTDSTLKRPYDVLVDANFVYVSDSGANKIKVFRKSDGTFATAFGGRGSGPGQMFVPEGMALGPSGLLYIADSGNNRIDVWCVIAC